jgi:hypothetical protein
MGLGRNRIQCRAGEDHRLQEHVSLLLDFDYLSGSIAAKNTGAFISRQIGNTNPRFCVALHSRPPRSLAL